MRLMKVDTQAFAVYRAQTVQRSRAGTKNGYITQGAVTGQLSPIRDAVSLEIYGDRVQSMYNLNCPAGSDLRLGDKVQYGSDFYNVVAVQLYTTHVTAQIEKTRAL